MNRPTWRSIPALGAVVLLVGLAGLAVAEPAVTAPPASTVAPLVTSDGQVAQRTAVDTPIELYVTQSATISQVLYLERCKGGCAIHRGTNDARTNTSSIPTRSESIVTEFANSLGQTGALADDEWRQIAACMAEVYSPYNVVVTDVRPGSGLGFHMAVIAGNPGDIGLASDILGVAPLASDCRAIDNVISFSFANHHPPSDRVLNICWTASQESAHAFGLDHEYSFTDGNRSACNDPMTYRNDCGGEKFFRNESANCGEETSRACKCGASQNSHLKVLGVFGAGTPTYGTPTASVTGPQPGTSIVAGSLIAVSAGARRGVARVALLFNGYQWSEVPGAAFDARGQPDPSSYAFQVPRDLPDSIVDIKAIAYDDLGASTESAVVTVTKGAACVSASTCATGQKCEAGRCFWDPPPGEIGDSCAYAQFCKSGLCRGTKDQQICTEPCTPGPTDICQQDGLACVADGSGGVCFFASSGGGCCSVDSGSGGMWWAHIGLAVVALGFVTRRRRR